MAEMTPLEKARKARTKLLMSQPFFGYLASKLNLKENSNIPTNATNQKDIFINPTHWSKISIRQAIFEIAHEVGHCVLRHCERRNGREHQLWNNAGDYAINLMLKETKSSSGLDVFEIPDDALISDVYAGETAEEIYEILEKQKQDCRKQNDTGCKVMDEPSGSSSGRDKKDGQGGQSPDPQKKGQGEGSGSESEAEPDSSEKINWSVAVKEAVQYAKARGTMSASFEQLIEKMLKARVNWKAILYRYMSRARKDDYSYAKPNRRYAHLGIVLPSLYNHTGSVVVAEDTSGSISDEALQQFASEVWEISRNLKLDVTWIQCDAEIQQVLKLDDPAKIKKAKHKGRGGTDFTPVFEYVREKKLKPDVLVYITDGYGSIDKNVKKPSYDVLWAIQKGGTTSKEVMRWGHIMEANL